MNNSWLILVGVLLTVIASLLGLVLVPGWQFQTMQPIEIVAGDASSVYPQPLTETAAEGREVYRSLGCIYCHSQQVRPEGFGADIERAWGIRRSVPRDYLLQDPPLMGTMRTGPDLSSIGFRQPNDEWHYLHLYDPMTTSPGSIMPKHKFLFELVKGELDANNEAGVTAFQLPDSYSGETSWIIPDDRAKALVAYLKSLSQPHDLEVVK
ncbi:MAG: cbb3-type cytochrome c oxidase subunit II [Planctomycetota bacterium]